MKTAVLISHSHPPAPTGAVEIAPRGRRRARLADCRHPPGERSKHGEVVAGIEEAPSSPERGRTSAWCSAGTARSSTRCVASPRTGVPVFGVNFGTVGFLAAVDRGDPGRGSAAPSPGRSRRSTCPASRSSSTDIVRVGLNDIGFSRRPQDRVAELSYKIAGEEVGHVRCDGLVASTPVGSTGYNLANQGPILAWGVKGYVVSYISPHSLTAQALVVAPGDVLHVENAAGREPVYVAVDGEQIGALDARRRARGRLRRRRRPPRAALGHQLLPTDPREVRPPGRLRPFDRRISASSVACVRSTRRSLRP